MISKLVGIGVLTLAVLAPTVASAPRRSAVRFAIASKTGATAGADGWLVRAFYLNRSVRADLRE